MGSKNSKNTKTNKKNNPKKISNEVKEKVNTNIPNKIKLSISFIKCTYLVKENSPIQIMNYHGKNGANMDIFDKIGIVNGDKINPLVFNLKFNKTGLFTIIFVVLGKLNDMSYMFTDCSSLKTIEFISLDTSQVTKMNSMFLGCTELESLDLSTFNTSNVTEMKFIFSLCSKLKEIKGINNFNTEKVITMEGMFGDCNELEYLDLSNFNTSNVSNMDFMFSFCRKLKAIKGINNFNTSKVNNMLALFCECHELEYLDLSNFNTSNIKNMGNMFDKCHKLKEIKGINNFRTENVFNVPIMSRIRIFRFI